MLLVAPLTFKFHISLYSKTIECASFLLTICLVGLKYIMFKTNLCNIKKLLSELGRYKLSRERIYEAEYAIAYILKQEGVKKLEFSSFGTKGDEKPNFNSITAYPCIMTDTRSTLLISLLSHFGFRASGGATPSDKNSWMQASFLYKGVKFKYVNGFQISGDNEKEILTRVYAIFNWMKENKDEIN